MNLSNRASLEDIATAHPCEFQPPSPPSSAVVRKQPSAGWDNETDIKRFEFFLKNDADPAIEGVGGDRKTYGVACFGRDLGISEEKVSEMMLEYYNSRCSPPWNENGLRKKVRNAFEYASGDAGSQSLADEFDPLENHSDDWLENGHSSEEGWLENMNTQYRVSAAGNRFRVMWITDDPDFPGQKAWVSYSRQDFGNILSNETVQVGNRVINKATAWLNSPSRKTTFTFTVDPKREPAAIIGPALNLWTGWSVELDPFGSWSKTQAMIRDVLCSGDETQFRYFLNWLAWVLQNPGEPAGVALVLKGPRGVGKTTIGELLAGLFGAHGIVVSSVEQFAGRFTGHLMVTCFVYADESFWGGDKQNEGRLKKLITDRVVQYESKGKDQVRGINRVSVMMATNEEWAVPAAFEHERRFFIPDISDARIVPEDAPADHPNRVYWNEIHAELKGSGTAAFLYDMLHMENVQHPKIGIPRTKGLGEQKLESLEREARWYCELLLGGQLPFNPDENVKPWVSDREVTGSWEQVAQRVKPEAMAIEYREWLRRNGKQANVSTRSLSRKLRKLGVIRGKWSDRKKTRYWEIPRLGEAREKFAKALGFNPFID